MIARFDESLPAFFDFVAEKFGEEAATSAAFVRDGSGYLAVALDRDLDEEQAERAGVAARAAVGPYVRDHRAFSGPPDAGAARLLREAARVTPQVVQGRRIRLLDRRIVGVNWLEEPSAEASAPSRIVFSSIKGGVGRSTALSVVAAHLSRRGRRVLAIDLDLEAPGIGTMLLAEDQLPRYGTLDYLVENGITGIDGEFLADAVGGSFLGAAGARVAVMPAIGGATLERPADALAKIARAYLEDIGPDGRVISLADQMRDMVDRFAASGQFDVILIDARAGLHETTATALLGLGAEVLLFGIDEPQTFLGYRLLMAHLARFTGAGDQSWPERLTFVVAKSTHEEPAEAAERFEALLSELRPGTGQDGEADGQPDPLLTEDDFELAWDDQDPPEALLEADRSVLFVRSDARFNAFDPVTTRNLLEEASYQDSFREVLEFVDSLVLGSEWDHD